MAAKYYAVRRGKKPGIYRNWEACKEMVDGYPGAQYKSFPTLEAAEAFLGDDVRPIKSQATAKIKQSDAALKKKTVEEAIAFVDGSYNSVTKVYGYGGFLEYNGEKIYVQGSGCEEEMASMRNVAGEVLGSMAAIEKALELGLPSLTIFYDYMGIEMWAKGLWKRNKKGTIAYYDYVNSVKDRIVLKFQKVKGHSGVAGNEEADRLAKEAVGILE